VKKLRIIILVQVAWVLCGAAFLAATPTRAAAYCVCPNTLCSSQGCIYDPGYYCHQGGGGSCYTLPCNVDEC
jgi:hypothetical protein